MSSAHDAHEAHAFDGEPVDVLPDDEPRTPGWLPVAGLVFFVGVAIVLLAGQDAAPPAAKTAMVAQAVQVQPPTPQAPQAAPPARPQGAPGTVRRLTPDQIQQIGQKHAAKVGGAPPPPAAH